MKEGKMTPDELNTKALEALRLLSQEGDQFVREEFLLGLLTVVYQSGRIDANNETIKRNDELLKQRFGYSLRE